MPKILIAGGTGLIGSNLILKLKQKKYEVVLLSTQKNRPNHVDTFYWNPELDIFPLLDLKTIDVCINFCGAPIFDKAFSAGRKKELTSSRVIPIQFLAKQFIKAGCRLPYYISASATGIYPNICLNELHEDSTNGTWFISKLVQEWEAASHTFSVASLKQCILRFGIVFSDKGGFLSKLVQPSRFFAGAIPGPGNQMISWIHIDDLSNMIIYAMEQQLEGTYNATAPEPESLENISKQVVRALGKPQLLPHIPEWMLKIIFGNERHELLMTSQKVSSKKMQDAGFKFSFSKSQAAIDDLIKK
jgi:uncharacterized protein (TIGR01777 family)